MIPAHASPPDPLDGRSAAPARLGGRLHGPSDGGCRCSGRHGERHATRLPDACAGGALFRLFHLLSLFHHEAQPAPAGTDKNCASCQLCVPLAATLGSRVDIVSFASHGAPTMGGADFISAPLALAFKPPIS
jgi:hypothetical protein